MRQHSRKTSPPDAETHSDVELVDASIQAQLQEEQKGHQREREREHIKQEKKQKSWFRGWWLAYIFMANVYSTPPNPLRLCAAATRKASPPRAAATAATRSSTSVLRRPCRCAGSWAGASMRRRCESRRDWERGRLL